MRAQFGFFGVAGVLFVIASCSSGGTTPSTGSTGGRSGMTGSGGSGGSATCAAGQQTCSGVCVDTRTDNLNCGTCGTHCATGQTCSSGACQCTGGLMACATGCTNLSSDAKNCGACGTACTGTDVCSGGVCKSDCDTGFTKCGQSCANTQTDATNCGSCGNQCAGGQACTNGVCGCPPGQTTCSGACVNTATSAANCGGCGVTCSNGQICNAGVCSSTGTGAGGGGGATSTGSGGGAGMSAGGANGGGGATSTGSGGGGGAPPGRNGCVLKPGLIADFEEGMGDPKIIQSEDRTGEWETFNDATSTTETMTVESSGGTADCDKWALHVKGSNYSDWGAGFGFSLVGTPKSPTPYNAAMRQFTGVRFKAKLGTTADSKSPVRFNISTPWTESKDNPGGQCTATTATDNKAAADCYQHVGRFLSPGTGDTDLSSTAWKSFTFCFDRDLYPLSLPSNLTNEQRDNIATNILKIQFQFNQGKDYSGSYPSNGEYPAFQKSLAFDFWLDDVEFFTGDCPNMTASPSNGSPMKPFPQNAAIGTCMPATNASKYASAIAQAYARWTKNFVQTDHIVAPEQSNAITSEAMGYGMLIAAAMGDKAAFDKFHGYVKAQGGTGSGGLMNWKNGGSGSASDADLDIAYALLMADKQWGGYATAASDMASGIASKDLVSGVLRGGSQFQSAPFNASYFAPAAFRVLPGLSTAVDANFSLVTANVTATTSGIPTDWANPSSGAPSGPGSAQVTSDITDGENGAMGYDAARVPMRLALDACLGGGNTTALKAIVDFFAAKYDAGASIDLMKAGWYKKNGMVHPMAKDLQGSFIGPMGVAGMAMSNAAMRDRALRAILDILENGDFNHTYFPSTLGLLTALMMSGNFPTP